MSVTSKYTESLYGEQSMTYSYTDMQTCGPIMNGRIANSGKLVMSDWVNVPGGNMRTAHIEGNGDRYFAGLFAFSLAMVYKIDGETGETNTYVMRQIKTNDPIFRDQNSMTVLSSLLDSAIRGTLDSINEELKFSKWNTGEFPIDTVADPSLLTVNGNFTITSSSNDPYEVTFGPTNDTFYKQSINE
jgi:hypothetical protein